MACDGYTKVWDLAPGELVKLDGARGTTLRVTRGMVWITLEHDTRDVVLAAGDTFTIDRGGLTLVEAQGATTVCVLARHVEEVRVGSRRPCYAARVAIPLAWIGDPITTRLTAVHRVNAGTAAGTPPGRTA